MSGLNIKSFAFGLIVATIGLTTVFASTGIKSATFNENKVIFNGKELDIRSTQMISVIKDGESNVNNYMPVRTILEQMGYTVEWDGVNKAVIITGQRENESVTNTHTSSSYDNNEKIRLYSDMNLPSVKMTVKNSELTGVKYNEEEYYSVKELSEALTGLIRLNNKDNLLECKMRPDSLGEEYPIIFTVSLNDPCFVEYHSKLYIAKTFVEQKILPIYEEL